MSDFSFGIVTVSDSCHEGAKVDESGPIIKKLVQQKYNAIKITMTTTPDEISSIEKILKYHCDDLKVNCIITTGGTGFAPRDVTPEATRRVIEKECPQLAMMMFLESLKVTPMAALSRAVCGIRSSTLIINFPGSKKAVQECFEAVQGIILHALQLITDQKDVTNAKHQSMQENFRFPHKPVVHEESFDSQSVISSTSGIVSVTDSNESLYRRVESINDRVEMLRQIKNSGSSPQRMDFTETEDRPQPQRFDSPAASQQYVARTSLIEVDNRSETSFASEITEDSSRLLTPGRSQRRFDSGSSSSDSISSLQVTVRKNEDISDIQKLDDMFSKTSQPMQEIILDDDILKPNRSTNTTPQKPPTQVATSTDQIKTRASPAPHVCPHATARPGDETDRNSPYPMLDIKKALDMIYAKSNVIIAPEEIKSPMNLPPFRASIKDGYAMKSNCRAKRRKVIGNISAGDQIVKLDFQENCCFKINTGAPVPNFADSVVQVEDTKLISKNADGTEDEIELTKLPEKNCDIREIGCDLAEGETLFTAKSLVDVPEKSILASVGLSMSQNLPKIAIISTGDELVDPNIGDLGEGKIYDSNSTMLRCLVEKHGFAVDHTFIAKDDHKSLKSVVQHAIKTCDVIISSGGVSMGDKDFVKPLMLELGFDILFGRVNMKPGKPMTFGSNGKVNYFALPGNPVSAFVTFHLFVLPSLRFMCGFPASKCTLPEINVILQEDKYVLDSRPEYARGRITYDMKKGLYYVHLQPNQISSRLASLINADVLVHLPGATEARKTLNKGTKLKASLINFHFISNYINNE